MAIYRTIAMTFWTDSKVSDEFSPEEKLLFLHLLTNPHTNLCGCYEISYRMIAYETGFETSKVKSLMDSLANVHNVIRYSNETKEVLILNLHKYGWTRSDKFRKPLAEEINKVKDLSFRIYLVGLFNGESLCIDTVSDGVKNGEYGIDTPVTVTVTVTDTVSDAVTDTDTVTVSDSGEEEIPLEEACEEIIGYLNDTTGQHYRPTTKEYVKLIKARAKEKFTVQDFKTVIYKKAQEWGNDQKMSAYLRPQTLFGNKFESYLNQVQAKPKGEQFVDDMRAWAAKGDTS